MLFLLIDPNFLIFVSKNFFTWYIGESLSTNHQKYQPIILIERNNSNRLSTRNSFIIDNQNNQNQQLKSASIIPKHLQLRRQPSAIDNDNENLVVLTTPTYRKLKFKRPQHYHRQHFSHIINSNITSSSSSSQRPSFQEIISPQNHRMTSNSIIITNDNANKSVDERKEKNKKSTTMVKAKYVMPSPEMSTPSFLHFYGPSMLQISRMKISHPSNAHQHRQDLNQRTIAKRKRIVLKYMKLKPNLTYSTAQRTNNHNKIESNPNFNNNNIVNRVIVIPNENNEIRDPRPKSVNMTPSIAMDHSQLTVAVRPLFAENEDFDILRNGNN